jgi:C1A family cysteine protease
VTTRKYGRKTPQPLPIHMMLDRALPTVLPAVDTSASCGPITDQGDLGSCTGHAFASAMEWIFRRYHNLQPILSPLYLYAKELQLDGSFPNDDGSDGNSGCTVAIGSGCCEDSLYPDSSQKILAPTPFQDANAKRYKMGAYHGLTGSRVALTVLSDPTPWPVEVGFNVFESFESDEVARTGIYNPNPQAESSVGGHETLMVGYDIGANPTIRPQGCPPAALIQNSWGPSWGLKGKFWMALTVLDAADTDLKIVHSGGPWR